MSIPFGPGIDELRKRAANELRRIVRELADASGMDNKQIAMRMGYKSRDIVSIMRNHQYGQQLYPEWALFAFLLAVGVRYQEDVEYVLGVYAFASGRTATRLHTEIIHPTQRKWWEIQPEPTTEEITVPRAQRREFEHILLT